MSKHPVDEVEKELINRKYFRVYLTDGSKKDCKLLKWGQYHLHVEIEEKGKSVQRIIPKHSIVQIEFP